MSIAGASSLSAGIDTDFYVKLLVTQLKHQDPMEPMSNTEIVTQMAQLAGVQAMNGLSDNFSDVLKLQRLLSGAELLGRQVEYTDGEQVLMGVVEAVTIRNGTIKLVVAGSEIELDDVTKIT